MKFKIRRTSQWNDDVPPLKAAKQEPCFRVDERTFKSPEEHDAKLCGPKSQALPWLEEGLAHRKTKVVIARDLPATMWTIEVGTIEDLMKLASKVGPIIVSPESTWAKGFPEI